MEQVVPLLVLAAVLVALFTGLGLLATRVRRSGVGRDLMSPVDLMYRPHAHEMNQQIQVQEQRTVALPATGDPRLSGHRQSPAPRSPVTGHR
ncbi:hypothetical protein GCM10010435_66720 [Winogradskya consettensis]|uniref:Uncharacterized protein n=1 Tax=Winogradskya consettensis TaxID=113560 RepID=A0A919VYS0_9ACTN|nr:hypothetical protein [Actinoplanes consettensis]GIM73963.1 hypothetical protein Aco04nite_38040 [Actinoplanes consettensis]